MTTSGSRSFFETDYVLRVARWWILLVILVVVGAGLGVVTSQLSPYKSDILLRINTDSTDSTRVTQLAQTSVRLVDADRVYDLAAAQLRMPARELRNRTVVGWISDSELVTITVEGPTAEASQRYATALSVAVADQVRDLAAGQLSNSRNGTDRLLATGALLDRVAEDARRQALGTATADRQDSALASAVLLTQIGGVSPAVHSGVSPVVGAFAGAAGGAAVAVLFAVTVGAWIGRVRRRSHVRSAIPAAQVLSLDQTPEVTNAALRTESPLIGVLSSSGDVDDLDDVVSIVIEELRAEGRSPLIKLLDPRAAETGTYRFETGEASLDARQRAQDLTAANADCLVAVGVLNERNLARLHGRADVLAVRIELDGRVRLTDLRPLTDLAGSPPVTVVVVEKDPDEAGADSVPGASDATTESEVADFPTEDQADTEATPATRQEVKTLTIWPGRGGRAQKEEASEPQGDVALPVAEKTEPSADEEVESPAAEEVDQPATDEVSDEPTKAGPRPYPRRRRGRSNVATGVGTNGAIRD